MMQKHLTILLLALLASAPTTAQVLTKRIVIVNGGQFGNPAEPTNVQLYNPADSSYTQLDSLAANSAQDVLIDGPFAYVAASQAIAKYDLTSGDLLATATFGGPSANRMALSDDYLLVGNSFLFGPTNNNLQIFDRETLALVDSVPALARPADNLVVLGDTAYVTQNFTNQNFADSAGFLVKVSLTTFEAVDTVQVNANGEDLGPLVLLDSVIYGLNGASNTLTTYNLRDGSVRTDSLGVDLQPGTYGARFTLDETGLLYTVIDGDIGTFDLVSRSVVQASIVDTTVAGFVLDTVNERFYVTQTDFSPTFNQGIIFDADGTPLGSLEVGVTPEVVGAAYNRVPMAMSDSVVLDLTAFAEVDIPVLANDQDLDNRLGLSVEVITPPLQGTLANVNDSLVYAPLAGTFGLDSAQYAITDEWGDRDSAWVFIDVMQNTSIAGPSIRVLTLFPNPTTDQLTLRLAQPWRGEVTLLDLSGRRLMQRQVMSTTQLTWSLAELPVGTYLLRGQGESGNWTQRVIKR